MNFVNVKALSSSLEKRLRQIIKGVAGEIDVVSGDIEGFLLVVELFDMLEEHSGFADTFLPHNADETVGPIDFVVEFPDIVHRGQGEFEAESIV